MKIVLNASFMDLKSDEPSYLRKKWMIKLRSQFKELSFGSIKELGDLLLTLTNDFKSGSYAFVEIDETHLSQQEKQALFSEAGTLYGYPEGDWRAILLDNYEKEPYLVEMEENVEREKELKKQLSSMIPEHLKQDFEEKIKELESLIIKNNMAH